MITAFFLDMAIEPGAVKAVEASQLAVHTRLGAIG
jgi:hypothetical protein